MDPQSYRELPKLPGFTFEDKLIVDKKPRNQHLQFVDGVPYLFDHTEHEVELKEEIKESPYPSWIAYDRKVLRFFAQLITGHPLPSICNQNNLYSILFYLEDDTVQVISPKNPQASETRGTLINRGRIPLPGQVSTIFLETKFYELHHFTIGEDAVLYGRRFHIVDGDDFTKRFMQISGSVVPQVADKLLCAEPVEKDVSEEQPVAWRQMYKLERMLKNDRKILRFFGAWDDRKNMFGDLHRVNILYYLEDDTMEIHVDVPDNSGRDPIALLVKRCKLPKFSDDFGETDNRLGSRNTFLVQSPLQASSEYPHYTDADLGIGRTIFAWGKEILLCDCDLFTQDYYKTYYGMTDFTPILIKDNAGGKKKIVYSDEEDVEETQAITCKYAPRIGSYEESQKKLRMKDRQEHAILSFKAILHSKFPEDKNRRFIIRFYCTDGTLMVLEVADKPSEFSHHFEFSRCYDYCEQVLEYDGFTEGKFLERMRVPKKVDANQEPIGYFEKTDFYVGAMLSLITHQFEIVEADEFTYRYMEKRPLEYPWSNVDKILEKCRNNTDLVAEMKKMLELHDTMKSGSLEPCSFRIAMADAGKDALKVHEIVTLMRHFSNSISSKPTINDLMAVAQQSLRSNRFTDFELLKGKLIHQDVHRKLALSPREVLNAFVTSKVPIKKELLESILMTISESGECGTIKYLSLVDSLNYQQTKLIPSSGDLNILMGANRPGYPDKIIDIKYKKMLEAISKTSE